MRNIGKQFTDDEHCPTIGEKLRRSGDRTILAVKMHGTPGNLLWFGQQSDF